MYRIEINTDNAAFEDNEGEEVARILRRLANEIESGLTDVNLRDINGNLVGEAVEDT
jgi:hypothetical protein